MILHSSKLFKCLRKLSFPIACSVALFPAHVLAQIAPDGTLPTSVEQLQEIMRINGGQQEGNNLFHSFDEFSIPEGMEAIFENSKDIENIFARITGNDISNINGILRTQGDANLFFINPNGIIFGENAQLNVGGSFVASTAESVEFGDGSQFSATNPEEPLLDLTGFPTGLGLGSNSGAITVNGNGHQIASGSSFSPVDLGNTESGLSVNSGKTLALIGGEINFSGGIVTAEGGKIEISSLNSGSVKLQGIENGFNFNYDDAVTYQDITLADQALLDNSGEGQGRISLTGKNILLSDGSFVLNQNRGNVDSDSININALETLKLSGTSPNGEISSSILSQSLNEGQGGRIEINTKQLLLLDKARINITTFSQAAGNQLNINATDLIKIVDSGLNVSTFAEGNAGNTNLSTSNLQLTDNGVITSSTFGTGNSGSIDVKAKSIEIAGASLSSRSNISATSFNTGDGGNVNINTEQLKVQDGASVSSSALAEGDAGNVVVNASKLVEVERVSQNFTGTSPESTIRSAVLTTTPKGQKAFGLPAIPTGNAGSVTVKTPSLTVSQRGTINVENQGTGNAGTLSINAEDINLDDAGSITAAASSGEGGNIVINTRSLTSKKNSNVTTTAGGQGNGGNITIDGEVLTGLENSDITASAIAGNGGNIVIKSDFIFGLNSETKLTPFSDITASSELGIDGTVKIFSPESNAGEEIVIAGRENRSINGRDLVSKKCTVYGEKASVVQDSGYGIPPNPLDSPYTDGLPTIEKTAKSSQTSSQFQQEDSIVEANQIKVLPDGRTFFVAGTQSHQSLTEPDICSRD